MTPLPIDPLLPEVVKALGVRKNVVLEAPPGAGKTTRVPRALLDAGFAQDGEIVVLEPRRLAARLSARRVAEELGEPVGERIGYQVRFEEAAGPRTRVRFVTEGILTRRMLSNPLLRGVSVVILDEFHERHLHTDAALALLRRLQRTARPDLRMVVMSATLAAEPLISYLEAASLRSEGRSYPVSVEHAPRPCDTPLGTQVARAVRRMVQEESDGDVLVFLPGAREIRRAHDACAALAAEKGLLLVPLFGDLSPAEQDRAVRPAKQRKVILSTNVAETSVTIEGVVAVVDSGLARIASHAPWSGLPMLKLGKISQSSAKQRAGRAGRTRPGRCLRLYTEHDYNARPAHELPEAMRADLSELVLSLHGYGVLDTGAFEWFERPPRAALAAAEDLLGRLGALGGDGALTRLGQRMLQFTAHPRLSRLLLEAEERGVGRAGALIAAIASERELRAGEQREAKTVADSDLCHLAELFGEVERAGFAAERARALGLDPAAVHAVRRSRDQLARQLERGRSSGPPMGGAVPVLMGEDATLRLAVLAGYPDRVARVRVKAGGNRPRRELVFAGGGSAWLAEGSVVGEALLVVAVDVEERREGANVQTLVRLASAIEADWLLELFMDRIEDRDEVSWNDQGERVESVRRLSYGQLVLEEKPSARPEPAMVERALFDAARARGLGSFDEAGAIDGLLARLSFLRQHVPELGLPQPDEAFCLDALRDLCSGRRSFAELAAAGAASALRRRLSSEQARALDELAPERLLLPGGRRAPIDYTPGQAPAVSSRLQDFFGMARGPALARGRVPLVIHLLAPNGRDVQVTSDLGGFWSKHYPSIAKELRRRYPRHAWPDDPLTAKPPEPRRR